MSGQEPAYETPAATPAEAKVAPGVTGPGAAHGATTIPFKGRKLLFKGTFPRWLLAVLSLGMAGLLVWGMLFYYAQKKRLRHEVEEGLQAIAQLKIRELAEWRANQLGEAEELMSNVFFIEGVWRWMADPQAEDKDYVLGLLRSLQKHYRYLDILLVDIEGKVRLSLSGQLSPLHPETEEALAAALSSRKAALTDLHAGPGDLPPHIDTIAPLFIKNGDAYHPVGAVVLQCDASQMLYPLLELWPTPSQTAETLLVRRDGDSVLFLNDLRHQANTALKLRIPLTRKDVPEVMAVLGKEGMVEGKDYRGVEVLSALKAVPDSPWFMVAKVDAAEVFAAWRVYSVLVLGLILGFLATGVAAVGVVWQRNAKAHYRTLFEAETARRKSEMRAAEAMRRVQEELLEGQQHEKERVEAALTKAREELVGQTRLAVLGQLAGNIAHELRNPLGAIRNAAYFLGGQIAGQNPKWARHLQIIENEVCRSDRIISNLLEMTRGKLPQKQSVDLGEVCQAAWGRASLPDRLRCRTAFDPASFAVHADPVQLGQVFTNIFVNAGQAIEGQGEVFIDAQQGGAYDEIVVRDTGPGVPAEHRDRLFEPLFSTRARGTGLGLAICRQIVERHGGTLELLDTADPGAAFYIRLPRAE